MSHYKKILARCESRLEAQFNDYQTWYDRGDALANLGDFEGALLSFDKALRSQPEKAEAWTFRGVVLIQLAQYQAAVESCDRALQLAIEPEQEQEAWLFRGVALYYMGQYEDAYASYDQALGIEKLAFWKQIQSFLQHRRQQLKKWLQRR